MKCKNCRNLIHKESDFRFPWCPIFDDCYDIEVERECPKFEIMSNADKIRNMSDEELAEFLDEITDLCNTEEGCKYCPIKLSKNGFCDIKEWLKSEVKE